MSLRWPVTLTHEELALRPLERGDAKDYAEVKRANVDWLRPWEATNPEPGWETPAFGQLRRLLDKQARAGIQLPWAITIDGRFRGQLTVSGFGWGSLRSASLGYWIDRRMAGHGYTPLAVALATDYCFSSLGLHRMEINIRPENLPSLRVVEKLGFRDEGLRERYMHIDGKWCDHRTFALLSDEVPFGLLERFVSRNST